MAEIRRGLFGRCPLKMWLLWTVWVCSPTMAQWEDVSIEYLLSASCTGSYLGCGLSCADFNSDGLDDLTVAQASGTVSLYLRTEDGFDLDQELESEGQSTGVLWVDVDGDGDLDLFAGRLDSGVKLYIRNGSGDLVDESLARGVPDWIEWNPRGISASDFDQDQDLDIYIASYHISIDEYHHPNALLINNGFGYFTLAADSVGVHDGIKTSFHGAWLDYDQDGWQDLWVINDRPSFKNAMYRNQGDGTFSDVVLELGLLNVIDPMTATVFDPDQDGDWDLFCTDVANVPHALFEQTDSGFVDVALDSGVGGIDDFGWGGCAVDVDGDAREDLMVATLNWPSESPVDNRLYMAQDSGMAFQEDGTGWPNEQFPLYHLGRFDLDGDRAPDIIGHGAIPIAQLLLNTNEQGSSRMTVRLVGTTSNSHAVGALIEVYAAGQRQMQQVDAGSDYVTQHSYTRFFGMDTLQTLDSIVVTWPGAATETWYALDADTAHVLVQGSAGAMPEILHRDCPWDDQGWLVPALSGDFEMTWNGSPLTSDSVWASISGEQVLEASWWNGTSSIQWTLTADVAPEEGPGFECLFPVCFGDSAVLSWSAIGAESVIWMDSLPFPLDTVVQVALDSIAVEWQYGPQCVLDTVVLVDMPEELTLALNVMDPLCFGGQAEVFFEAAGGTPPLLVDWNGADPTALIDGLWPVAALDAVGCAVFDTAEVAAPPVLEVDVGWSFQDDSDTVWVELDVTGGTPPYDVMWSGGLDGAGWVLAPASLDWVVEDAGGCGQSGTLDLEVNGTGPHFTGMLGGLRCWRADGVVGFEGPVMRGRIELYDLTGRLWWSDSWSTTDRISCDAKGPMIIRTYSDGGKVWVFLR